MRTALILLVLVFAPLALPAASAQETNCVFTLTPPAAPAPIAPGTATDILIEAQTTTTGRAVTVTVVATTTASGWTLGDAPAPAAVTDAAPGRFTFTITPSESATETALVTFSASGVCDPPGPLGGPLGGQCTVANACVAQDQNAQVTVTRAPEPGLTFPFLEDLNIRPELLIAGVVLIGLASAIPFLMRRSKGGIVAQCPEPLKMVKPGRGTSFPIELRNGTKEAATATFEVGPVPEGWSAFMPLPEVQLASREARSLWLMVRSPATATNGDAVDVELRLRDPEGKDGGLVKVRAEVQGAGEG